MGPADGRDYRVAMGSRHVAIVPDDAARYRPTESDVVVEVGATIPIDANLAPRLGSIVVQSVPPGASILRDGESVGMTPKRLADLFVGTYKLELNAEKFVPWTQDVTVKEGETTAVNAELKSVDLVAYEAEQRHQHMVRATIGGSIGLASAIASGIAAGLSYSYNGQRQTAVNTFDTTTDVATLNSARATVNSTSSAIRTCEIVSIVTGVLAVAGITWAGIDFFTAPAEPSAH